ncbi:MAG: HAMP domain-containing protein [Acidobacteria bacterium]|nr:HAMP domain-containing protein [Acidobacteriota bacterium]
MAEQAERITAQNLHKRLEIGNAGLEISRLARVFNELLSRLDRSFERMRQFTADASHELRTPLAVIRGEADVALSQGRRPAEYRETLGIIQDEAVCLSRMVEDLLNLARRDAGHCPLEMDAAGRSDFRGAGNRRSERQNRRCRHGHRHTGRVRRAGLRTLLPGGQSAVPGGRGLWPGAGDCEVDRRGSPGVRSSDQPSRGRKRVHGPVAARRFARHGGRFRRGDSCVA